MISDWGIVAECGWIFRNPMQIRNISLRNPSEPPFGGPPPLTHCARRRVQSATGEAGSWRGGGEPWALPRQYDKRTLCFFLPLF